MAAKPVILAVDDDADVLRLIKSDLRKQYGAEYRILSADGGQALRQPSASTRRGFVPSGASKRCRTA